MIAVILFFVVIIATAILLGNWATNLDKKEKELKTKDDLLQTSLAHLRATEEVVAREKEGLKERELNLAARKESILELEATLLNKQTYLASEESRINDKYKDADDAWQKCLEEGNRLMEKQHELEAREAEIEKREKELKDKKADVSTREAVLGFLGVPEAQDIIEPVEGPEKVVEKPHSPAYVCPLCGGEMYGRSDGKNTEYVCSDCGYIATVVPTDKKPVKKARKAKK